MIYNFTQENLNNIFFFNDVPVNGLQDPNIMAAAFVGNSLWMINGGIPGTEDVSFGAKLNFDSRTISELPLSFDSVASDILFQDDGLGSINMPCNNRAFFESDKLITVARTTYPLNGYVLLKINTQNYKVTLLETTIPNNSILSDTFLYNDYLYCLGKEGADNIDPINKIYKINITNGDTQTFDQETGLGLGHVMTIFNDIIYIIGGQEIVSGELVDVSGSIITLNLSEIDTPDSAQKVILESLISIPTFTNAAIADIGGKLYIQKGSSIFIFNLANMLVVKNSFEQNVDARLSFINGNSFISFNPSDGSVWVNKIPSDLFTIASSILQFFDINTEDVITENPFFTFEKEKLSSNIYINKITVNEG